eukprot:3754016-Amphidinium_carterae.1
MSSTWCCAYFFCLRDTKRSLDKKSAKHGSRALCRLNLGEPRGRWWNNSGAIKSLKRQDFPRLGVTVPMEKNEMDYRTIATSVHTTTIAWLTRTTVNH